MIVDFHTHVFPDRIAARTVAYLAEKGNIPPFSDGTVSGLLSRMAEAGVDVAVTLPVLTSPEQYESVNRYAEGINAQPSNGERRLISFAGIHPRCEDVEKKMEDLRARGFLGVKIHPDYQETFIDDAGYERILRAARDEGMIVLTHAGCDVGFPGAPVRCTPERVLRLIDRVPYGRLVLAHMGGCAMAEEALRLLCGADVYLDTAYVLRFLSPELFSAMLAKHGAGRILFGSDSPWSDMAGDVRILRSLLPDAATAERIFSQNALSLLGL